MNSLIVFLVDRSGSMYRRMGATVKGLNQFIAYQQMRQDDCDIYISTFGDRMENAREFVPIFEVAPIDFVEKTAESNWVNTGADVKTFDPDGGTAGWENLPGLKAAIDAHINALPAVERPAKVTFIIQSDGGDNALLDYRNWKAGYERTQPAVVRDAIATVTEMHQQGWQTLFLATDNNREAIESARILGIKNILPYSTDNSAQVFDQVGLAVLEASVVGHDLDVEEIKKAVEKASV